MYISLSCMKRNHNLARRFIQPIIFHIRICKWKDFFLPCLSVPSCWSLESLIRESECLWMTIVYVNKGFRIRPKAKACERWVLQRIPIDRKNVKQNCVTVTVNNSFYAFLLFCISKLLFIYGQNCRKQRAYVRLFFHFCWIGIL